MVAWRPTRGVKVMATAGKLGPWRRLLPLALCLATAEVPAAEPDAPRLFQSDGRELAKVKRRAATGDRGLAAAVEAVRERADRALGVKPLTIVHKPKAPPSGDRHDYVSMAPYFWPNPATKDGL